MRVSSGTVGLCARLSSTACGQQVDANQIRAYLLSAIEQQLGRRRSQRAS